MMGTASAPVRFISGAISRQFPVLGRRITPMSASSIRPKKARTSCTSISASYVPWPIWAMTLTGFCLGRLLGLASPS